MTYTESAALMQDQEFRGRIKVACLKYADAIIISTIPVASQSGRVRWAQSTYQGPDMQAAAIQPAVVMDAAVQDAGADISDAGLQASVETVVNKMA